MQPSLHNLHGARCAPGRNLGSFSAKKVAADTPEAGARAGAHRAMMLGIAAGGVLLCCMTGGIKELRPSARVDLAFDASPYTAAVSRVAPDAPLPRLVVFDLDNTLWTPELYTLRYLRETQTPIAGNDVWMLSGAAPALHEIATRDEWRGTQFAIASRQDKTAWARDLLEEFRVPMPGTEGGPPLSSLFKYIELRTGTKKAHFRAFHEVCFPMQQRRADPAPGEHRRSHCFALPATGERYPVRGDALL